MRIPFLLWQIAVFTFVPAGLALVDESLSQEVSYADPFRYLRQDCLVNTQEVQPVIADKEDVDPLPDKETVAMHIDQLPETGEPSDKPLITIQPTQPEEDNAEILSFEAWKERQYREAVSSESEGEGKIVDREDTRVEGEPLSSEESASRQEPVIVTPKVDGNPISPSNEKKPDQKAQKSGSSNGKASTNPPHRYNYASPDCSARVTSSSSASQHASSVLHKSKDRYMLTPCNAKEHWVVIELCDDIRIEAVEIGMFEFFSGVIKEIKVSVETTEDEDEDNTDKNDEWQDVGTFHAKNVRGTQLFSMSEPTGFRRFIRLDFPAYYGKEYYCPISSVKVYGMNQMEAYKWEVKRSSQREDEKTRKQAEEDARRKLPPASTVAELLSTTDAPVPAKESLARGPIVATEKSTPSNTLPRTYAEQSLPRSEAFTTISVTSTMPVTSTQIDSSHQESLSGSATSKPIDAGKQPLTTARLEGESARPMETVERDSDASSKPISSSAPSAVEKVVPQNTTNASSASNSAISIATPTITTPVRSASSPSVSTTQTSTTSIRQNTKSDSSESIYAFIIRRLNALEGNATLAMMYVEEQTKANRNLLHKMDRSWADWKMSQGQDQRIAFERERLVTNEALTQIMSRYEEQSIHFADSMMKMEDRLSVLTEEITWERRRGIAQLCMLVVVIVLAALARSATVDVQPSRPPIPTRTSMTQRVKSELQHPDTEGSNQRKEGETESENPKSPINKAKQLSGARSSPRRPGTPVSSRKARPTLTINSRAITERSDGPRTALPGRPRQSLPPNMHPLPNGRKLARSSHLHTIDAGQVRRKLQFEGAAISATPSKGSGTGTPFSYDTPVQRRSLSVPLSDHSVSESTDSEEDIASASEAETMLDTHRKEMTL